VFPVKSSRFFLIILFVFSAVAAHAAPPRRIISLAPSVTKDLYLLGAGDKVVAVTVYCPPEARKTKEGIGTVQEPNIEKIVSLSPDLVIASREGNREETVATLRKLGISVFVMGSYNNFADICNGFHELGKLIGKEEAAQKIITESRNRIDNVYKTIRGKKPVTVFWEVGAQPLFTVNKNTFVNEFMERAGGINIFGDLPVRYPQISREEVVSRDPDVIMLVTMGDVTTRETRSWGKFTGMKAVKSGRIYVLSDSIFTDPTPVALAEGIEKVAALLYAPQTAIKTSK